MTNKEIVKALRCCAKGLGHDDACENCKVGEIQNRREYIEFAAANVIERLTAENAALREKVPQWISVEDRLPEAWKDEDGVLVNYMIYTPEFGADIGNYHAMAKRWLCMAIPCTVTHWMPLPGAPEEGEKHE